MDTTSCQNTWTVVCFLEEGTVEAVPTSWIFGELCCFPAATKEKITSAISKNDPVNLDWPSHKIRTFINGTYESYSLARQKARLAEDTSDLNSESEASTKKRVPKRRRWSSDSDSDEVTKLPPPPKFVQNIAKNIAKPSISDEEYRNNINQIYGIGSSNNQSQTLLKSQGQTEVTYCNNLCKKCCNNQSEKIWDERTKNIATQCHIIRSMVLDLCSEIKQLKDNYKHQACAIDEAPKTFFETVGVQFPLDNEEDLIKFEHFLNNKENFELAAKDIARYGGNNSYEFVKRAMTPIISNKLAKQYNWEGKKKNKRKFSELNLAKLIIDSDKKGKISTSQKECEKSIVAWLKRAKEREERISKQF